jgi:hypothetical protein
MFNIGRGVVLVGMVGIIILSGCQKDKTPTGNTCTTCSATSFKADIIPILNQNCAGSTACHQGSFAANGHLNLDSTVAYAQLTAAGTGYVLDSNAVNSIFYDELASPINASTHMPIGIVLDQCTVQKVYCWIQEGAPNN